MDCLNIIDSRTDLFDCSMDSLGDNDDDSIALAKLYYKSNLVKYYSHSRIFFVNVEILALLNRKNGHYDGKSFKEFVPLITVLLNYVREELTKVPM